MLIDSHAHLDAPAFNRDRDKVIDRALEAGIGIIVTIGTDLASSRASMKLAEQYPQIFATIGFHPHYAAKMRDSNLSELGELCHHPKVVAIGEIGLDFYRNLSPREEQFKAFDKQLKLAAEHNLPVVIHSRQAHQETLDVLTRWAESNRKGESQAIGVIHCFSGDSSLAEQYLELGFVISIAGPVTYDKHSSCEVARDLPLEKLVVETDCPALTPRQHRNRRNEPAYLTAIVERIAQIKEIPPESVARSTGQNVIRLFRLPPF